MQNLKFIVSTTIAVSTILGIGAATAADLPARAYTKAPAVVATPNWYGSFIGVNGGGAFGNDGINILGGTGAFALMPALTVASKPSGGLGGVTWGTNWQTDRFVYGFISDFDYADIHDSAPIVAPNTTGSVEQRLRWFSTSRVRLGYLLMDNLLLYGSGGLADGDTIVRGSASAFIAGRNLPGTVAVDSSKFRYGWAAGGGLEYQIGRWSVMFDYVHYDLGKRDVVAFGPVAGDSLSTSTRFSGDVIRGGLNYRFNWTFFDLVTGARPFSW